MYTLEDIKQILDAEDATTLDGYNVVRTNIMTRAAEAINELDTANGNIAHLTEENERLKAANMTLYSKIEKQIMDTQDPGKEQEEKAEDGEERTAEEVLEDNITVYKDI